MKPTDVITKYENNPIITAENVPYSATLAYNCGACRFRGRYLLLFRVDYYEKGFKKCKAVKNIAQAWSDDGFTFSIQDHPVLEAEEEEFDSVYDPRITAIDDELYLCYATDTPYGIRLGIAKSDYGRRYERIYLSEPDNRNAVMFPERIDGCLVRLDRPFARIYRASRPYDIWLSRSRDGRYWGDHKLVLAAEDNEWSNDKIGPATPPIRTDSGWLCLYHGVTVNESRTGCGWEGTWKKTYQAGVMLLDPEQPHRIIGRSKEPVLVPDRPYETEEGNGMRPNVVFPGGLVPNDDGTCMVYWGGADTVVCAGTADIQDLIDMCTD